MIWFSSNPPFRLKRKFVVSSKRKLFLRLCGDGGTLEEASMWNKMKNDELSKLSLFGCSENCVCMKRLQQKIY